MIDGTALTRSRVARRWLAPAAMAVAMLTAAAIAVLGASGGYVFGAVAYLVAVLVALYWPAAIVVQVIAGQLLAASMLLGDAAVRPPVLLILPVVVAVIGTAELLAAAGRSNIPLARGAGDDLRRTGAAVTIAAAIFAVVALIGRLPGPTGILAIALASAACAALAILLVRDVR